MNMTGLGKKILTGLVAGLTILSMVLPVEGATIKTPANKFVRTASMYMRAGTDITVADYPTLAKFDLLVFPLEAQYYNAGMFAQLRKLNPNIVILAYVPTKSWNDQYWTDPVHARLRDGIREDWWLKDGNGNQVSVWSGTRMLNPLRGWGDWLARFTKDTVMASGAWDGIFYDEFSSNISWVNGGNLDLNGDGIKDDPALADAGWKRAMVNLLKTTRDLLGPDAVIVTNGDSTGELQPYVNGRMFESFPTPWEAGGTWQGVMGNYLNLHNQVGYPATFIINMNGGNSDQRTNYRRVRYGLVSALLGDGYFSYDYGEQDHGQLWRYDEYDVNLGRPINKPINMLNLRSRGMAPGVWRRDFEDGVALVNTMSQEETVAFGQDLEKIKGTQAPEVNDGTVVTSVTLAPQDGILLRKPISKILGSTFPNGMFARVFDRNGQKLRNGFFAYDAAADGQADMALLDLNGDGQLEKVSGGKTKVTVWNADGTVRASFAPYGDAYGSGVHVAVGDLDGDAVPEIVTGTGVGGGPQVRIFSADGRAWGPGFFAGDKAGRGGVQVAVADVYGTKKPVIVTGGGKGTAPFVRVYSKTGQQIAAFQAYGSGFTAGVRVAAGDLDGDGKAEIVTGAAPGGGPHVRVFSGYGKATGKGFFAGDPAARNGVFVAAADIDKDGKAEILTLTADVFQVVLR